MAISLPQPLVPFSEPAWLTGFPSPYYKETHRRFQKECRTFMETHLLPYAMEWEREGTVPEHLFQTFARHNMLIPYLPAPLPVEWLKRIGIHTILETPVEEWDHLHTGVFLDEITRPGVGGPAGSISAGHAYGIPPILKFANQALQERFLPDLLPGKKRCCIAITEPSAGSDVANIQTMATKTADGQHYLVNGQKKWITNGIWSDYATMAVRTGGPGSKGISLILCPLKGHPGVKMRRLKVVGQRAGGTTFIDLDDVRVPVENLIGEENAGLGYIMTNFNHERLTISITVARQSRVALSAAMEYVMKREAFGKPLVEQPVVRHRLAKAGAQLEMLQAWIEQFLYSLTRLSKADADVKLGGLTALCKATAGMVLNECAQTAVLLFGGNGYTQGGQGEIAEALYREVNAARIPGGSEDVMLDLAIRQLVKNYRSATEAMGQRGERSKL